MNAQTNLPTADNGLSVEALIEAQNNLAARAKIAQFTWCTECEWMNGMHTRSNMKRFSGLGEKHTHTTSYSIHADYPKCFAAEDNGPTPTEILLTALASCLSANIVTLAQNHNIQLSNMTTRIEGDMNVYGITGMGSTIHNNLKAIRINIAIHSDSSLEDIKAIIAQAKKYSTVFNIIEDQVNINITIN